METLNCSIAVTVSSLRIQPAAFHRPAADDLPVSVGGLHCCRPTGDGCIRRPHAFGMFLVVCQLGGTAHLISIQNCFAPWNPLSAVKPSMDSTHSFWMFLVVFHLGGPVHLISIQNCFAPWNHSSAVKPSVDSTHSFWMFLVVCHLGGPVHLISIQNCFAPWKPLSAVKPITAFTHSSWTLLVVFQLGFRSSHLISIQNCFPSWNHWSAVKPLMTENLKSKLENHCYFHSRVTCVMSTSNQDQQVVLLSVTAANLVGGISVGLCSFGAVRAFVVLSVHSSRSSFAAS